MLTNLFGTHYVLNEHGNFDQYGSFAIPSKKMLYQSYPESLVNQYEIPIELSCWWTHLALSMSLMSMKLLANITHMQYHAQLPLIMSLTSMKIWPIWFICNTIWHKRGLNAEIPLAAQISMQYKIGNMLDPQSHQNPQPKRSSSNGTLNMIPPWNIHTVKQSMPRSCSNRCSLNWFTPCEFFQFSQLSN